MTYFDIHQFANELEQAIGPMPRVVSAQALFAEIECRAKRSGESLPDPHEITRMLFARGGLPCRLPDGSLGYFNVNHFKPGEVSA